MSDPKIGLNEVLAENVRRLGFTTPTPIQEQAIPIALSGDDLLACAATGSGKTAAFLLPTIQRLMGTKNKRLPRALVITPTRELAAQVAMDLRDFTPGTRIRGTAVFGGVGMGPQVQAFRRGVDVVVATPGRLLDHMGQGTCDLSQIETLILDEADRMLDMGFLPDIRRIISTLPEQRQTLFFSATMPKEIATLTREILVAPKTIAVERQAAPAAGVRQRVIPVAHADKKNLLVELLDNPEIRQAICFTRTKHRADRLATFLDKEGVSASCIHGDRSQGQRQRALDAFKRGRTRVLVATDIAARGIDVEDLSHVINFDVPMVAEDYIHRVGRTARANREGDAVTFVSREEEPKLLAIEKELKKDIERETNFEFATDEDRSSARRPESSKKKGKGKSKFKPRAGKGERPARDPKNGNRIHPKDRRPSRPQGGPAGRDSNRSRDDRRSPAGHDDSRGRDNNRGPGNRGEENRNERRRNDRQHPAASRRPGAKGRKPATSKSGQRRQRTRD